MLVRRGLNLPTEFRRLLLSTTMTTPTASWGFSIPQHLRTTKELLQCATFDTKYVWSCGLRRVEGLRSELAGPRSNPRRTRARRS